MTTSHIRNMLGEMMFFRENEKPLEYIANEGSLISETGDDSVTDHGRLDLPLMCHNVPYHRRSDDN